MKREKIEEEIKVIEKLLAENYKYLERWEKSEVRDYRYATAIKVYSENIIKFEDHLLNLRIELALPDGYRQTES